jgi:hypothetical protein
MGWSLNCSDAFSLPARAGLPGFVRLSAAAARLCPLRRVPDFNPPDAFCEPLFYNSLTTGVPMTDGGHAAVSTTADFSYFPIFLQELRNFDRPIYPTICPQFSELRRGRTRCVLLAYTFRRKIDRTLQNDKQDKDFCPTRPCGSRWAQRRTKLFV